jgi:hypothetical protein
VDTEHLRFKSTPSESGKTAIVDIYSVASGDKLGQIRWFGRWRQYCFYPENLTIWNTGCMESVVGYIDLLMHGRRVTKSR